MTITAGPLSNFLWQGLAADPKPTTRSQPVAAKINDVFFETDTQKWFIYNGDVWTATAAASPYVVPPMA